MERRSFLRSSAALGSLALLSPSPFAGRAARSASEPFHLKFAPHFGMFRGLAGDDLVAQLELMHAEGFRALEDNGMPGRSLEDQERVAEAMRRLGMEMGVFVAHAQFGKVTFASDSAEAVEGIVQDMERAVEVAQRVNARWCTVVPGTYRKDVEWDYQTATVIENLKRAAAICEPHGLVMVLEPLNAWRDHPGLFLTKIPQAYLICRAVGSPSCKILNDLYHQQITEGNLIPNIDRAWDEIAYYQVGDNPGRKEPGTGEIHYKRIFQHLFDRGFDGIVGMEHGNAGSGAEGERAVIDAYRRWDPS
jgi:hydroxypyruvate isomerase